ncbi:magnesium chelatase domain-containing protein, partial [Georgenia muralis]
MGLGRTRTVSLLGLQGHVVEVEAHVAPGLPAFTVVGLPDASVNEAKERVRAAVTSSGLAWPARRTTVNLSPATLPKTGSGLDLALAVAVLAAVGLPGAAEAAGRVHLGELGLDGRLHPVRGILPAVAAAVSAGRPDVVVPAANAVEARLVPGAVVRPVHHLAELLRSYGGDARVPDLPTEIPRSVVVPPVVPAPPDLAEVLGQDEARFALEVAAAGGHHLFLVGP